MSNPWYPPSLKWFEPASSVCDSGACPSPVQPWWLARNSGVGARQRPDSDASTLVPKFQGCLADIQNQYIRVTPLGGHQRHLRLCRSLLPSCCCSCSQQRLGIAHQLIGQVAPSAGPFGCIVFCEKTGKMCFRLCREVVHRGALLEHCFCSRQRRAHDDP